ncbi:MAG: hypothetical protein ACXVGF_04520 [Blastococcus sp.]
MPRKKDSGDVPSRYLTFSEVAHQLRTSVESVREKALIRRELEVVDVGNGSERAQWRVVRTSFEAYCARREAEAAQRFAS